MRIALVARIRVSILIGLTAGILIVLAAAFIL